VSDKLLNLSPGRHGQATPQIATTTRSRALSRGTRPPASRFRRTQTCSLLLPSSLPQEPTRLPTQPLRRYKQAASGNASALLLIARAGTTDSPFCSLSSLPQCPLASTWHTPHAPNPLIPACTLQPLRNRNPTRARCGRRTFCFLRLSRRVWTASCTEVRVEPNKLSLSSLCREAHLHCS